ncbi:hypothetical protein C8F01DRAFT_1079013 [Mycena amicta]|nr:hypothetical protein C8F01DRAFT_1079013 [Mycena amicta]
MTIAAGTVNPSLFKSISLFLKIVSGAPARAFNVYPTLAPIHAEYSEAAPVEERANAFNIYPTLAPIHAEYSEAAPVEERANAFNIYPTLAPEAAPVEERDNAFNIYPTLAPEATHVVERDNAFNIYPTLAPIYAEYSEAAPVEERANAFNIYPTLAPTYARCVARRRRSKNAARWPSTSILPLLLRPHTSWNAFKALIGFKKNADNAFNIYPTLAPSVTLLLRWHAGMLTPDTALRNGLRTQA